MHGAQPSFENALNSDTEIKQLLENLILQLSVGREILAGGVASSSKLAGMLRSIKKKRVHFAGYRLGEHVYKAFWERDAEFQPGHVVYRDPESWKHIIPVSLHGKNGRIYLKQPMLCWSWESVLRLREALCLKAAKADRSQQVEKQ